MNTNNTNNTPKKATYSEFKVFILAYEYTGYCGYEKFAIATDLSEEDLVSKYGDLIKAFEPFVLITTEMGEAMSEYNRNEAACRMRACRGSEIFLDDIEDEAIFENSMEIRDRDDLIMEAINMLSPEKRSRFIAHFYYGYSIVEIAARDNCTKQAISQDLIKTAKQLRSLLEKMGVAA